MLWGGRWTYPEKLRTPSVVSQTAGYRCNQRCEHEKNASITRQSWLPIGLKSSDTYIDLLVRDFDTLMELRLHGFDILRLRWKLGNSGRSPQRAWQQDRVLEQHDFTDISSQSNNWKPQMRSSLVLSRYGESAIPQRNPTTLYQSWQVAVMDHAFFNSVA